VGERIGPTVLVAALFTAATACAAPAADLLPEVGTRVRIQADALGPGWHEGLFSHTRVPRICYDVLIFKPRRSRTAAMEWAATVPIERVTALEVDTAPQRPMQEWVGLPATDPAGDPWRPVPLGRLRDANAGCRSRE
jgi:hypothetical protein